MIFSRMIFSRATWRLPISLMLALSAILLLPYPYRDVLLVGVIGLGALFAWIDLERAWLVFIILLPLLRLPSGLFHTNALLVNRFVLVSWVCVLVLKQNDSQLWRALIKSNGFRFYGVFILANIVSAVHVFQATALFTVLAYLEPLLFFVASYQLVRMNRENESLIVRAVLVGGIIFAAIGLYEMATQQSVAAILNPALKHRLLDVYMSGEGSDRFGLGGRISSLIGHPVMAGLYFAFMPILGLYYFSKYAHSKWAALGFGLVCALLVLATGTRGALMAFGAGILVLALLTPQRWSRRFAVLAALLGGTLLLFLFLPNLGTYLAASFDFASNSVASRNVTGRLALTRELLRLFQENWFLGYGPAELQKQAAAGILPTVPGIKSLAGMENQYATILADGGIVAGFAYLLFMIGVIWDSLQMMRQPRGRAMGVTLLALFAAYFVFASSEMTLATIPSLLLMAIYGAFAAQFERAPQEARV